MSSGVRQHTPALSDGMPFDPQPDLVTARLRLRPFIPADAFAVQALAGAYEVANTTLTIPHPYPEGAAEGWIATHGPAWAARKAVTYAITDVTGTLVGAIGLALVPAHASAEVGYWIGVPAWGRGYATEAAAALFDHAFGALGVHRIEGRHFTRNAASGRVMQKLGMRLEGVMREAVRRRATFEDLAVYAVLGPEWMQSRPGAVQPRSITSAFDN
ncbi:MAG: GNAT family N-acetyltransferase [Gemmatimonadaceae bacterium]